MRLFQKNSKEIIQYGLNNNKKIILKNYHSKMRPTPEEYESMMNIDYMFKRKKEKNDNAELRLQKKLCEYLQTHYPDVYFISDALGLFVLPSIRQTLKATNSNHKHLDIIVLKKSGIYSGLVLEIKKETPFKKDGTLKQDEHLEGQQHSIKKLIVEGFKAMFIWDMNKGVEEFHEYLGEPVSDNIPLF